MDLDALVKLHNDSIQTMNAQQEAIRYLESALLKAREAHAAAVKSEATISALVTATYNAQAK